VTTAGPTPEAATVLIVEPLATGGLHAHVHDEIAALRAAGLDVRPAAVSIGPRPRPLADLRAVRALRAALRADGVRAVHAHGLRAGALTALARGRRGRAPRLVVTLHNRTVGSAPSRAVGAALLRVLARRADAVLAVSPDLVEDARAAGAREVALAVVPARSAPLAAADAPPAHGAAASAREEREARETHRGLDVLVIARLAPQKGLHDLLDAAALLGREHPGAVRVRVVGEGPQRPELAARIAAEQLEVELLGHRDDVPELLARCDLVVSAAVWEGQPVALQEALHAGRAIVATDAGGTASVVGDAARLVPVGDAPALSAAILELADPAARARAEAASRSRAAELPGIEDMTTQLRVVLAPRPARR